MTSRSWGRCRRSASGAGKGEGERGEGRRKRGMSSHTAREEHAAIDFANDCFVATNSDTATSGVGRWPPVTRASLMTAATLLQTFRRKVLTDQNGRPPGNR